MTHLTTDVSTAVALLQAADPVGPERLAHELDLAVARERVTRLIAADASGPARAPRSPGAASALRRLTSATRVRATIAALAAAGTVAVAAVVLDSGTPAVQSASARTITLALRAVTAPAGSILHIDATTTQIDPGHPTYIWDQEAYEQTVLPFRSRVIDKRLPGTPPGTEGVDGAGIGEQFYDPIRNIIYAPPVPKATPSPGAHAPTPAQEALLYEPYMAQYVRRLRAKLASGRAHVAGRAFVNGRRAIKITFAGSDEIDYVAADGSYVPIKTIQGTPSSADGQVITVFHTFEYLKLAGNAGLLELKPQHPSALIDRSLADFRAALKRLFRDG